MTIWLAVASLLLASFVVLLIFSYRNVDDSGRKPRYFWGAMVAVAAVSLVMYQQLGAQRELSLGEKMASLANAAATNPESSFEKAMELVRELEAATEAYPDKAEYWYLLGVQQISLERFSEAASAFAQAYELMPGDISLLASQTEAEYVAADYRLTESVKTLIDQVLEKEPNNSTVMGILGITAYRGAQYEAAVQFWERALSTLPPMSTDAETMRASIAQARMQMGQTPAVAAAEVSETSEPDGVGFAVNVMLASGLEIPPQTTLFVFVRQAGGPPMPIVVERTSVGMLPAQIMMDDSKVMIQGQSLANFPSLEVVARVSFSGQPTASSGDYQAVAGPFSLEELTEPLTLVISDQVP